MTKDRDTRALNAEVDNNHVCLAIKVQPRASRNRVKLQPDGSLKVYLTAPPVEGAANAALLGIFSETLRIPRRNIKIISGKSSRSKLVRIYGMTSSCVKGLLGDRG